LDLLHTFKRRRSSRRRCRSIGDDVRVRRSVGRQWRQWFQVARVRVCVCVCIINVGRRCCVCRRRSVFIRRVAPVRCLCSPVVTSSSSTSTSSRSGLCVYISVYPSSRLTPHRLSPLPPSQSFTPYRRRQPSPRSVPSLPYNILTFAIPFTRYGATTPVERPGNNNTVYYYYYMLR